MALKRRYFLKEIGLLAAGIFLEPKELFASPELEQSEVQGIEQRIMINLPAYELKLMNLKDGKVAENHVFPVSIGRGAAGREPTPLGQGLVYEKRKIVVFRYNDDVPQYNKKKGDFISQTNTYDEEGKPISLRVPYREMRGLGTKIKPFDKRNYDLGKVIHSSLDDFKIGTAASYGCIELTKKEMLVLYELVAPHVDDGKLKSPIDIKTLYELVELKQDKFALHANVYQRPIDYLQELKASMARENVHDFILDEERLKKELADAGNDFAEAQKQVLEKLVQNWPNNYVSPGLKKRLHRTYSLNDFRKAEV